MVRRLVTALLVISVSTVMLSGCGPDPKEAYAERAAEIVTRWQAIIDRWNASPGDAKVATDFASLQAEAKTLRAPAALGDAHALLLKALEAEATSFELYAIGKKKESLALHDKALSAMETYMRALRDEGLVK